MKEKVLILASVASMIDQFNMSNISILLDLGYEVHVACNFEKGSTCTQEKVEQLRQTLKSMNVTYYQVDFTRSVFNLIQDIKSYKQVKEILVKNKYKFIHCHSPIGGVIGRLVCRATNTKCIYTAHGFHFFKGAPLKNWILFYPIEKWLSKYTDILITINKEDCELAKKRFHMKRLEYVPGVGVDIDKFQLINFDRDNYRRELGLSKSDFVILSIGELNKRKNHEVIMKAIAKLNDRNIKYLIAGQGELDTYLNKLGNYLNIENQFKLLGFRKDIPELCNLSDLFAFPSKREGLGLAAVEAMAAGLPIITSNINGINDFSENGITGYKCNYGDVDSYASFIKKLKDNCSLCKKIGKNNIEKANKFSIIEVNRIMKEVYYEM